MLLQAIILPERQLVRTASQHSDDLHDAVHKMKALGILNMMSKEGQQGVTLPTVSNQSVAGHEKPTHDKVGKMPVDDIAEEEENSFSATINKHQMELE